MIHKTVLVSKKDGRRCIVRGSPSLKYLKLASKHGRPGRCLVSFSGKNDC